MRQERIRNLILQHLEPTDLYIDDESHTHAGRGLETHFKVLVVSDRFKGQSRVARQRSVNDLLKSEFDQGLHALSLRCLTADEFDADADAGFDSPNCANRKKKS